MTKELFEKAKFGDRFVTRGGQEALFLRLTENSEWQFADFYVKDWGLIRVNRENGKCLNRPDSEDDIVGMMPSHPSGLDEAEFEYAQSLDEIPANQEEEKMIYDAFKAGAQWRDAKIPKLPDSIDEAAEEYAYKTTWDHGVREDSFKAGAEWMAGQGHTVDGTFHHSCGYPSVIELKTYLRDYEGADVIVQIRKKQ